jgi:trimeric autotransporter adhesin
MRSDSQIKLRGASLVATLLLVALNGYAFAQGTAFSYQGKLNDNGVPANGQYDFQFKLFDTATVGTGIQQGSTFMPPPLTVSAGIFTVQLDFGACPTCFNGAARFLEITVKPTSGSTFTTLGPRQPITTNPYAIRSATAATADGLSLVCVNCVTSSQIASVNGSAVTGTIPVASVPAGSVNYVQNTSGPQASSNFNISGNGTAGGTLSADIVNAATRFNLGGQQVLTAAGSNNLSAGINAGTSNNGIFNAFFGASAGLANNNGNFNAFFGAQAGQFTTGNVNAFFGSLAGSHTTTGISNSFFGAFAGQTNTTGNDNAFFGYNAGNESTTANQNAFFGSSAGFHNTTGQNNAFFGFQAGQTNTTASENAFFGASAGNANTSGNQNAFFGSQVGSSNTTGSFNAFFGRSAGLSNVNGSSNTFFGAFAGQLNTSGHDNAFFGRNAGVANTGIQNAFFGSAAGSRNTIGQNNTFIGAGANFNVTSPTGDNDTLLGAGSFVTSGSNNATAIGALAQVEQGNSLVLGSINGANNATSDTSVGIGTTTPGAVLDVQRDGNAIPETARFTTYGFSNEILGRATGGNRALPTATPSGRVLLQLGATGHDGTAFSTTPRATILMSAAEAWTNTTQGTSIKFNTTTNGTASTVTRMFIADDGNIGINTTAPDDKLEVNGIIRVNILGSAGATPLCHNSSSQIATCSSSLRYKTEITPFTGGLALVKLLRPITFSWKQDGMRDVGFGAEEVAEVAPLFTFRNDRGEIEGVKYDRVSVLLVNAIKEQQTQIEQQQAQINTQHALIRQQQKIAQQQELQLNRQRAAIAREHDEIEALKRLVCAGHPRAASCQQRH